jgi:hypothetical protein
MFASRPWALLFLAFTPACGGRVESTSSPVDASFDHASTAPDASTAAPPIDTGLLEAGAPDAPTLDAAPLPPDGGPVLDPSPCLTGGDVFYDVEYDRGVLSYEDRYTSSTATLTASTGMKGSSPVALHFVVTPPDNAPFFQLDVHGIEDDATQTSPLQVGTYGDALDTATIGHPLLSLYIEGVSCGGQVSTFQIASLDVSPLLMTDVTVAFSIRCGALPSVLFGCIHVENLSTPIGG